MKTTIRKISTLAVAVAALFGSTTGLRAQSYTLADLVGGASFVNNGLTFSGFSVSQSGSHTLPTLSQLTLTAGSPTVAGSSGGFTLTGYDVGLYWTGNGSNSPANNYNLSINYTVTAGSGLLINNSGFFDIQEAIAGTIYIYGQPQYNPYVPPAGYTTNLDISYGNLNLVSGNIFLNVGPFSPVSVLSATLFYNASTSTNYFTNPNVTGGLIDDGLQAGFMEITPAPEPTTLALAALGGASLLLLRRRK